MPFFRCHSNTTKSTRSLYVLKICSVVHLPVLTHCSVKQRLPFLASIGAPNSTIAATNTRSRLTDRKTSSGNLRELSFVLKQKIICTVLSLDITKHMSVLNGVSIINHIFFKAFIRENYTEIKNKKKIAVLTRGGCCLIRF